MNNSLSSIESNDSIEKYSKISSYNSRIPIKTRQFSAPIQLLDDKKSSIPRITSTSETPINKKRRSLSPIDNNVNNIKTLANKISTLSLDTSLITSTPIIYSPKIRSKEKKFDDSPLFQRLTRSTTAFNLKLEAKKLDSPSKVKSNIPRSTTFKKLDISPNYRQTRSSELRKQAIKRNVSESTPAVPKKLSIPKSYTINTSLNDLKKSPSIYQLKSKPLKSFNSNINLNSIIKLNSIEELNKSLKNSMNPSIKTHQVQSSLDILTDPNYDFNNYEKAELLKYEEIYYISKNNKKSNNDYLKNFGFDDENKNLIINLNDHINYRYQIISKLGKGMFGNVLKCYDHKLQKFVSIKIMKNDVNWSVQSINEIKILRNLQKNNYILSYFDHFNFRSHICISTELLSFNLLEILESTKYKGFNIDIIKTWSKQILSALNHIHSNNIIHADLKPENIMLKDLNSFDLKIIDFGSSCNINEITYPYIQSRFYRAPEVLLGCQYDTKIDIWSFLTLIYEMYTGKPLFPVKNETELFTSIIKLIGQPSSSLILEFQKDLFEKGSVNKNNDPSFIDKNSMIFTKFDKFGKLNSNITKSKKINIDNLEFLKFLQSGLIWNYKTRPNALDLLHHDFLKK